MDSPSSILLHWHTVLSERPHGRSQTAKSSNWFPSILTLMKSGYAQVDLTLVAKLHVCHMKEHVLKAWSAFNTDIAAHCVRACTAVYGCW